MTTIRAGAATLLLLAASAGSAHAGGLAGSLSSMKQQHGVAVRSQYEFLATQRQLGALVEEGRLERLDGNADYLVHAQVTHPYARAEVREVLEHVAAGYRAATGQQLVVTSLVRPRAEQPGNAHRLSVHPAGMAVDLRVPADPAARRWLEQALLGLEQDGALDVTREFRPPHYHVAVFPAGWSKVAARLDAAETARRSEVAAAEADAAREAAERAALFGGMPYGFAALTLPAAPSAALVAAASPAGGRPVTAVLGVALALGMVAAVRHRTV